MKTVTSVSGGQSSAYIAANYPSDYLVFALVTTDDPKCKHPDKRARQKVSDLIGREFIGTLEDDTIIYTMLELEQWLQQEIHWVAGETFDKVAQSGGLLPNKLHRFCTVEMKLRPIHRWWKETINEPVKMQIGFRAGEERRATRMLERCNADGLLEFKDIIGKHSNGNNKWATTAWQKPTFPMIDDGIHRDKVVEFWKDVPLPFADRNNCVGCFHRNPLLLRKMWDKYPDKMEWFSDQEKTGKGWWRYKEISYDQIKKHKPQHELSFDDFSDCDSGHCGL
tara:strand:+ start:52 stop:891 length:840 start_codon:yes stop_codon:yes gene_type:complete